MTGHRSDTPSSYTVNIDSVLKNTFCTSFSVRDDKSLIIRGNSESKSGKNVKNYYLTQSVNTSSRTESFASTWIMKWLQGILHLIPHGLMWNRI